MVNAVVGTGLFAPALTTGWLCLSMLVLVATAVGYVRLRAHVAPTRPRPAEHSGALRGDTPAVVNMLTNDATVTAAAMRATVVDLAARGWLRILPPDEEVDELARVRPAATAYEGDALRPHERLVLQHVMARFATDRAIPARYLAVDIRGGWWRRFAALVADDAKQSELIERRWSLAQVSVPAAGVALAGLCWFLAWSTGDTEVAVIDSVTVRVAAGLTALALVGSAVGVARLYLRPTFTHTESGVAATRRWLAVRHKLDQSGFAELAPSALELGDRRLAYATAMCLADGAAVELPLAREDHRRAWSSVGGRARLVRVKYPIRIAYGMAPFTALGIGVVACFGGMALRRWADDVARGEAFEWIYERIPEQDWLIADVATALTFAAYAPILIGLWMALAGAADGFSTIERTGFVLRNRRPAEISPLPRRLRRLLERDRYRAYVAVDDGTSDTVTAWKTTERHAVPQGARATVRGTPVLGHVRRATPVGHRLID
ncbi:MAG: hypothetical protein WBP59_09195 [Ilumatobacteraceae bacterium]